LITGHILETHIKERVDNGHMYKRTVYVGDGGNDFCPSLRLKETDYIFPRDNYALHKKIENEKLPNPIANVVPWSDATEILQVLLKLKDN